MRRALNDRGRPAGVHRGSARGLRHSLGECFNLSPVDKSSNQLGISVGQQISYG